MIDVAKAMRRAGYDEAAKGYSWRALEYTPGQRANIERHWFRFAG